MSTETPETRPEPVAATPPTPQNVAEMLTSSDGDYHDGNYWHPSITSVGNVISIGIEPYADDDGTRLPEVRFTAVVVEGETVPIVLERPVKAELELPGGNRLSMVGSMVAAHLSLDGYLLPEDAREIAAHLAALADDAEAAQTETERAQ